MIGSMHDRPISTHGYVKHEDKERITIRIDKSKADMEIIREGERFLEVDFTPHGFDDAAKMEQSGLERHHEECEGAAWGEIAEPVILRPPSFTFTVYDPESECRHAVGYRPDGVSMCSNSLCIGTRLKVDEAGHPHLPNCPCDWCNKKRHAAMTAREMAAQGYRSIEGCECPACAGLRANGR